VRWRNHCCYVLHILSARCGLSYRSCKAHASYCIVICGLFASTTCFPHYSINGNIFVKSYWTQNVHYDFLCAFVIKISRYKKTSTRYYDKCSHVKYSLFFSDLNKTYILWADFWVEIQISSFIKILPVGVKCYWSWMCLQQEDAFSKQMCNKYIKKRNAIIILNTKYE
jgi:hypothetical protein